MFMLDTEMAYINWYVAEKEFYLTRRVRLALNKIYIFMSRDHDNFGLSCHKANLYIKKRDGIDLSIEYLKKMYKARQAHVKNAKAEYKKIAYEKRNEKNPNKEPLPVCECGCGTIVKPGQRFVNGHNSRCKSQDKKNKQAEIMRYAKEKKKNHKKSKVEFL